MGSVGYETFTMKGMLYLNKNTANFKSSNEKFIHMTKNLQSNESLRLTHSSLEKLITKEGRDLMRLLLEEHIQIRGTGDIGLYIIGVDGIQRSYRQIKPRTLITVFGKVKIKRTGYSFPGKSTIFPLDANLNLPSDIYSYGLRKAVAYEVSKNSFSEAIEAVERNTGVRIPKRQAEELAKKAAQDFNYYYEQTCAALSSRNAKKLTLLVITTDGKGIVVRHEDLTEGTKKRLKNAEKKLSKRLTKGEKKNRKRMATVASVYEIAKFFRTPEAISKEIAPNASSNKTKEKRPRPQNKRVWASLEKTQENIIGDIFDEALQRDPKNKKEWVCLIDGDKHQLKKIRKQIKKHNLNVTIILDIIHVIEYLWKAARVFYDESSKEGEKWVSKRLLEILKGNAGFVAGGMRRSATMLHVKETKREPVDKCANYLLTYSKYLHYDEYLKQGMPIATGVIEGACRHLIKDRMDITGARWSLSGAEAVLKLRSVRSSGDFDEY